MPYFLAATGLLLVIFLLIYRNNKASVLSGFAFVLFLLCAGITYALFVVQTENPILEFTLLGIAFVALAVLSFGVYALIAFLLLNARLMLKRERRSLANSLTLLLGLGLIALLVVGAVLRSADPPLWVRCLWAGVLAVLLFFAFHIFLFLTSALLCCLARPPKRQDYIVVLGSGLVNGEVPPLLAARIDKAIAFYHRQAAKRTPPKLVMSGGQGPDEPEPEAEAMRRYALQRLIPEGQVLVEAQSRSTAENMAFSRRVMEDDAQGRPYRCIYATNGYHLLRAGIYARRAGLAIDGIGARTAWYYRPSAMLREYFAFCGMHPRGLILITLLMFALGALVAATPTLLAHFIAGAAMAASSASV